MSDENANVGETAESTENTDTSKKVTEKISEYSGKLIALYQKLNRPKELRKELLYQMKNISQGSLTYVNLLKDMTPPEDWPELREQLLSAPNQGAVRMELMEQINEAVGYRLG